MATINLGAIKFNWKGAYAGGTAYTVDDVVSSGGSSYVCILASTGNATSNATYWSVMAEGGDVATTLTTQGDVLFRDGSGLQRLAKGTATQTLKMNAGATAPEWATVTTPTSDYVRLQTTTLGSATTTWSVDGWTDAAYKHYEIHYDNLATVSSGGWYYGRFNIAGSTHTGSDYRFASASGYATSVGHSSGNPDNFFKIGQNSTDSNRAGAGTIKIFSPAETGRYTFYTLQGGGGDGATNPHHLSSGGFIQLQAAVTGITIIDNTGGNVNSGTMTIYGIKGA